MSHQSDLARLDEKKVSCPAPSLPVQSSSDICIKKEYFEDQLLMTVKTEFDSPLNQHNIMQSLKVEVKEEEHDEDDKDCPECLVKRELDFDEGCEQMDTERSVKIALHHSTSECSRSTTLETSSSSVPPTPTVTHSTTIQDNIKVEIEDSSTVQSLVQLCKAVKKEEDGGEYVMECDCEDCETCRVKMEMKEELDESGETEFGGNNGETGRGYIRVKEEEEDGEGECERLKKIQRMSRVIENVSVGSLSPSSAVHCLNVIPLNVEFIEEQVATSSTNAVTIEDHTQPSQPVISTLPASIVQLAQSSLSQHVNETLRDELINAESMMDNVALVVEEGAEEEVEHDNSTLNLIHIDHDDDEEEGDETIEQRQDPSACNEQQVPAESFLKRIEPDELGNRFLCDYQVCGKRMKTKQHLISHIRTHTGEKPFRCSVDGCDQAFVQNSQLKAHLNTHSGTRLFDCSWPSCEAQFGNKSNLTVHLRTHTGERPFECDQCDATFTQHGDLVTHLRSHTGARPFVCTWPECSQAFTTSGNLKKHSSVHSNERQFACDARGCTKVYKRKETLRLHQMAKHN